MRNIIIGILLTALLLITAASAAPGDEDEELAVAGIGEFGGSSVAPMCVPTTYTYEYPIDCDTNKVCVTAYGKGSITAYSASGTLLRTVSFNRGGEVCITSPDAATPIARIKVVGASATRNLTYECNPVTPDPDPTPEIPEFPTIALPMAAILGLAFVFMRRKN